MLKIYVILPFFFALILSMSVFLKNPVYIRRIAKTFFVIQFIITCAIFFCLKETSFSILNFDFNFTRHNQYLLFLSNFIFFIFSIVSKSFILKLHRLFYSTNFLLLGLINLSILCDNIFLFLISLFWIFIIEYFLSISFFEKKETNTINLRLINSLIVLFISIVLIIKDFARYFLLNDISFTFSNLAQNIYRIDDLAILSAFLGFLILISRLFNFIPFNSKNLINPKNINPFIFYTNTFCAILLGSVLFYNCYNNFDFLFYQYQDLISVYFLLNFIIFIILSLRLKDIYKFSNHFLTANIAFATFAIFSFTDEAISVFSYFIFVLLISYCLCATIFMILANKFNTSNLEEFKKINDKSRLSQFFIAISLLNLGNIPLLSLFSAELICFMMIFSTEYDGIILNIVPYFLILGIFFLSFCAFSILYKILIAPIEKSPCTTSFCNHQIIVCMILTVAIVLLSICPQYLLNQI